MIQRSMSASIMDKSSSPHGILPQVDVHAGGMKEFEVLANPRGRITLAGSARGQEDGQTSSIGQPHQRRAAQGKSPPKESTPANRVG